MRASRRLSSQTIAVLDGLEPEGWSYGYDLCRSLGLKAGTVYPILIRLAERGLVEASWEQDVPPGRPPRHLYRLSPKGVALVAGLDRDSPTGDRGKPARRLREAVE
ncbi:MAG: PadR family transcriptional regulator [Acidimicrobiia bacterium]